MDLKLAITIAALIASVHGVPVPPGSPKYVPVFVSSDALNQINEKDRPNGNQAVEPLETNQGQNSDYDINKEHIFNGPPAPVYEHQPDQHDPSYSPQTQYVQQQYQRQPGQVQQYQNNQQPGQILQQHQNNQQPPQIQPYQPIQVQQPYQQPNQQYQISQPAQSQLYQINQQPSMQPIVVAQTGQPVYGNQQQILPNPGQQSIISNQQPMLLNQQQITQPMPTYQQPNQLVISAQPGNQQMVLTQPAQPILINQQQPIAQPNQQAILLQPNQNGQALITSNVNPISLNQPNQVAGYVQGQNQNVYAMVPLGQNVATNQNVGTNTYLVPVQQMPVQQVPNQVYAVNSG